jgi:molecular chaperone HtpG
MNLLTAAEQEADKARELPNFRDFSLPGVREKVAEMLSLIGREGIFSTYTIHNISHVDSMLGILNWLIPESTRKILTPVDWLLTVLAVYLHDLGLVVTTDEFNRRNENPEFVNWFNGLGFNTEGRDYLARTRRMTEEEKCRFFFQEYVRKGHAARIREWITGRHSRKWGKQVEPLASAIGELLKPLPVRFREHLGTVCESHHEENLNLLNLYPLAAALGSHDQEIVNLQYAAVLLRSADLLHVTKDRTPSVMYKAIRFSDPKSVTEWDKQRSTFAVRPKKRRLVENEPDTAIILIGADFMEESPFFALQEYVAYADQQIRQSKRWIDLSQQDPDGEGYSFPWNKVEADVRLEGVPPVPLKFELDRGRLLDLLVGHTIYNDPLVAIRELLQNSIDAIRYQHYLDTRQANALGRPSPLIGKVVIRWDSAERLLTVEDNGTGMNRDIIDNHLMRVGVSFYDSAHVLAEHKDFSPISRFGIGILTCFMISDDIEVVTYRDSRGYRLKMTSVHASYALRELGAGDPKLAALEPHGTRVVLRLRDSVDLSKRSLEEIVRYWIILPECVIEFVEDTKPPLKIGFDSVADALQHFHPFRTSPTSERRPETVVKSLSEMTEFEGVPVRVHYELAFIVVEGFHPEHLFARAPQRPLPMVCIEGIRVADSLPGFEEPPSVNRLATLLSVRGSRKFRTTVSRSGLEKDDEYDRVAKICVQLLLQHIREEVSRIVGAQGNPLSQASSVSHVLTNQIVESARKDLKEYVWELFAQVPSIVVERSADPPRTMLPWTEVNTLPELWTLEARLLDLLGTISRDIGRELSLNEFISNLAPNLGHFSYSPLLPDAHLFGFNLPVTHHPELVHFSRQHQFSAVQWVVCSSHPNQLALNLEDVCDPDYLDAVNRTLKSRDNTLREHGDSVRELNLYAAPIRGDSDIVEAVSTRIGVFVSPNCPTHLLWTRVRGEMVAIARRGETPDRLIDLYLIASAMLGWIRGGTGRNQWKSVWAQTPDEIRQLLDLPRAGEEMIKPNAVFNARVYWRDWARLTW